MLYLMFSAPPALDGGGLVAYAAVTYVLWGVTYTMMDIPYWSMIPAFTEGGKEREGLSTMGALLCGRRLCHHHDHHNVMCIPSWRRG